MGGLAPAGSLRIIPYLLPGGSWRFPYKGSGWFPYKSGVGCFRTSCQADILAAWEKSREIRRFGVFGGCVGLVGSVQVWSMVKSMNRVDLRMTAEEKSGWERCAKMAGVSLSEWIRRMCNREVVLVGRLGKKLSGVKK